VPPQFPPMSLQKECLAGWNSSPERREIANGLGRTGPLSLAAKPGSDGARRPNWDRPGGRDPRSSLGAFSERIMRQQIAAYCRVRRFKESGLQTQALRRAATSRGPGAGLRVGACQPSSVIFPSPVATPQGGGYPVLAPRRCCRIWRAEIEPVGLRAGRDFRGR
jgi:hypothetical protein